MAFLRFMSQRKSAVPRLWYGAFVIVRGFLRRLSKMLTSRSLQAAMEAIFTKLGESE
jgi:hypothetical protein